MTRIPQATESLAFYEGLIFKTAQMTAPLVEDDLEDVQQTLRIKVWMALQAFDSTRGYPRERWVFMLMRNQVKDILKKKRRGELCLDTVRNVSADDEFVGDSFDEQYLAVDADSVFADVEREIPLIPSTLTDVELRVVCLLYGDFKHGEVALALSITKRDVERHVRSVRLKMADWKPEEDTPAPLLELLPQVETLRAA